MFNFNNIRRFRLMKLNWGPVFKSVSPWCTALLVRWWFMKLVLNHIFISHTNILMCKSFATILFCFHIGTLHLNPLLGEITLFFILFLSAMLISLGSCADVQIFATIFAKAQRCSLTRSISTHYWLRRDTPSQPTIGWTLRLLFFSSQCFL